MPRVQQGQGQHPSVEDEGGAAPVQGHVLQVFQGDADTLGVVLVVVGDVISPFGRPVGMEVIASRGEPEDDAFIRCGEAADFLQHLPDAGRHVLSGVRTDAVAGNVDGLLGLCAQAEGEQEEAKSDFLHKSGLHGCVMVAKLVNVRIWLRL